MIMYASNALILFFLSFKEVFIKKTTLKQLKLIFAIFIAVFSFIAGIRYGVGEDFFTYLGIFNNVTSVDNLSGWIEPGFRLLIFLFKSLGFPPQSLFFVFSFIAYTFLVLGLKKINLYPVLAFFLFFLVFNIGYIYNVMRQGIAMTIFIFLLDDIHKRKWWKVFFFSLVAASIHYSGLLILILYIVKNIKISKKIYIFFTAFFSVWFLFSSTLSNIIITILPDVLSSKIFIYAENFNSAVDLIGFSQRLFLIVLLLFYYKNLKQNTIAHFEQIFFFYFIGFALYCIFSFQGMFATRINMFFRILEIVLLPCILDTKLSRVEKTFVFGLIILYSLLIFYIELQNPVNYPFQTFL